MAISMVLHSLCMNFVVTASGAIATQMEVVLTVDPPHQGYICVVFNVMYKMLAVGKIISTTWMSQSAALV